MTLLLLLGLQAAWAQAGSCERYRQPMSMRGWLVRRTFAEQPNYESIAGGDRAATYYFLSLRRPVCVDAGLDELGPQAAEEGIPEVQLVFSAGAAAFEVLRPYLGKTVECRGRLQHAVTGHHHSLVLLAGADCHAVGNGPRSRR